MSILNLTAAELMTQDPVMIAPTATLRAAGALMCESHLHCLLVPGAAGHCVGIITTKDIVQILGQGEPQLLDRLHVSDAATTPAISVQKTFLVADCLRLMQMSGIRSVPVVDGIMPVGILSFTDVLRAAVAPDCQGRPEK